MEIKTYRIAVGPLLYYWPRQATFDFYDSIAASAADIVYVGETVCSRRHELRSADWLAIATMLRAAGKEAVLSSQTLIDNQSDVQALRRLCQQQDFAVEAGDLGAVRLLAGRPFIAGQHLNIYAGDTLRWLHGLGAMRFLLPLESNADAQARLLTARPAGMQAEIQVWGRMPLAFSARCFTARHFRLDKDHCEFRCIEHADGLTMRTRDSQDFLAINGIQTQSAHCLDLLEEAPHLAQLGIDILRVSPQSQGTLAAIADLATQRQGHSATAVNPPPGMPRCNGYWHGQAGIELVRSKR
jgi:collagenase-like PrtC family protease